MDKTYEKSNFLGARIKPKQNRLELEVELDTKNENYSKIKGEQFALNVDGKQSSLSGKFNIRQQQIAQQQTEQPKYFRSNLMDKQVYQSTNATLGQMNKLYHLGLLNETSLHLTPVQSILQMKPSFEYFDIYEKKVKDIRDSAQPNDAGLLFYHIDRQIIMFFNLS
jgi:DNA-directed RNA polymerase-3 subunit RPC5